jgi:hypothetical protein
MTRNRRAGVEDRWRKSDGTPSTLNGKGSRWRARFVDDQGREHARSFARKIEAQQWLDQVTAAVVTGQYVNPKAGQVTFGTMQSDGGRCRYSVPAPERMSRRCSADTPTRRWGTAAFHRSCPAKYRRG